MNKQKVFMLVGVLSLVILISLAFVNVGYLQIQTKIDDKMQSEELCSVIRKGLKFCTPERKIIVAVGNSIILNFTVTNTTENEIDVVTTRNISSKYNLKITDETGEIQPTKWEQKRKSGLMTSEDEKEFLYSILTNHQSETLKPNQVLNEKIVLSDIYDFTNVGKYYVEVTRKTINPTGDGFIEIPLEKIEIEVKQSVMPKSTS